MTNLKWGLLIIPGAVVLLSTCEGDDYQDALTLQDLRCEQYRQWVASGGERGWPDYSNTARYCPGGP